MGDYSYLFILFLFLPVFIWSVATLPFIIFPSLNGASDDYEKGRNHARYGYEQNRGESDEYYRGYSNGIRK